MILSLNEANLIIDAAQAYAAAQGLKPLTVAVLDAGSHLIALQRSDGAATLRPDIAIGKAASALALGINSRAIGDMAVERPTFVTALGALAPQGIVPAAGGVIILDADARPIGAVGITGDTSDNDEAAAFTGIRAAGLAAQK